MSELERLKADLEVLDRYHVSPDITRHVKESIVRIEDAADPWRDAKEKIQAFRLSTDVTTRRQVAYVDYLTDAVFRLTNDLAIVSMDAIDKGVEIERLTARISELEAAAKAEDEADLEDALQLERDMCYRRKHAAKYHDRLVNIVRRLLEHSNRVADRGEPITQIFDDAADLLAEMQAKGGENA